MSLTATDKIAQSTLVSYEEYLANSLDGAHTEWVNGEIVPMAPISDEHQYIGAFLLVLLNTYVHERDLGFVLHEPFQMKTSPHLPGRSPDILFVSKANGARIKKNLLEGPADLVIEIISPGSQARDRGEKFYEYEQGGVVEYWLIDPQRKQAEFYLRGSDGIYHAAPLDNDGIYHSSALQGFWIKTTWLWHRPTEWSIMKQWKLD